MLTIHIDGEAQSTTWRSGDAIPANATWLDLCEPRDDELDACARATRLRLPARNEIAGMGLAGRNRSAGKAMYLHVSRFVDAGTDEGQVTPVSLVLTPRLLVTQRYAASPTFEIAAREWDTSQASDGPASAFAELVETMAEHTAQGMQDIAGDVAGLSDQLFADGHVATRKLRHWLVHVGKLEARLARSRGALLGIMRIVVFMCETHPDWVPPGQQARLRMVRHDLAMLDQFDEQLTEKLQFLLDSIFGFIGVNQNNVMKIFTVASVVAVPPVLLAGIWGMNFKAMPALAAPWGYAMALGVIATSILVPLAIFKWRGWLSND